MTSQNNAESRQPETSENRSNSDENRENWQSNHNNQQKLQKNSASYTEKYFEGQISQIGGVLALQGETNVQKRVSYDKFRDLLCNYVATELNEANNVTCLIRNLEDPVEKFEKNKPKMEKKRMDQTRNYQI